MPDFLSVDAAVALLDAPPAETPPEENAPAAQAEPAAEGAETEAPAQEAEGAPESEAEPTAEEQPDPAEATGEQEAEEQAPASRPASEAPRSWDATAKDEFAKLPRAIQDIVLARADQDSRAVSKAIQEANDAKTVATGNAAKVEKLASELTSFLPEALKTFGDKWGNPDWVEVQRQYGAEETLRLQNQYNAERQQIGELIRKEGEAKTLAHQNFVERETAKLAEISPQLSDATTGPQLRTEVAQWAINIGAVTPDELPNVSAAQLHVAHKAMLYDRIPDALRDPQVWERAQALLAGKQPAPATTTAGKPGAAARAPARPAVRPSAAQAPVSQTRAQASAAQQFSKSRSIDDAVALLETRKR